MKEEYILQQVGLSEKESRVYLACLQLGEASILQLAKKAELKRPHVYNVVEGLSALSLLSKTQKHGKTLYIAEEPKRLKQLVKIREEKINEILPSLEAFYNVPRRTKPKIKIYEGKKAMEGLYWEITKQPEIYFFGVSVEKLLNTFPVVAHEWIKEFKKRKVKIKELFNYSELDVEFSKKLIDHYHQIRFIPKNLSFFGDSALYGNKVALISLDNLFIVTIESDDVVKNIKTLFELAWESAEQI